MTKYNMEKMISFKKTHCDILEVIRVKKLKKLVHLYSQCISDMVMGF
jgi:hypothetical protein